jgi:thiamine kinase-like enzyme
MLPDELAQLADRHVPGAGALDIHPLNHGVVNDTYKVRRGAAVYALRVAVSGLCDLGLDRVWEARVLESAAAAQLAPPVEYCDPKLGILISRWVEGRQWHPADVRRSSGISRMAQFVRRIHALPMPAPVRRMDAGKWVDHYSSAAHQNAAPDSVAAGALRSAAGERLAALALLPSADSVLCHSDLHTLNLIDRGHALVLLDWEYAHAADPFWDLAGWSANNDFGQTMRHEFLAAYNGRPPTPSEHSRLNLLVWLYDYVSLLWCELCLLRYAQTWPGDAARKDIADRFRQLAVRLTATASSRAV